MAPSKIRRAIGHVKDRTSISLAKVSSSGLVSDLEIAIVKATRHEEYPAEERHVREILSLTSYSRSHISACVKTLSKRLNKTRNWTVALKTLMLIQRLLSEGDPAYEQEIFFSTRRGSRILNMSDFRDTSHSNSWDFSAFVRTYALYLDERLEYIMEGRFGGRRSSYGYNEDDNEDNGDGANANANAIVVRSVPVAEMKNEQLFSRLLNLQQLLDRFLACRPIGAAKCNRLVAVALHPIVKESFRIYYDITEILGVLIDRFMELDMSDSIKIYNIFCRERKQFDDLDIFYSWCKSVGIARSSDYPEIEKITKKKLDIVDEFIRDKSALGQAKRFRDECRLVKETEACEEDDVNAIKALPEPNPVNEETEPEKEEVDNSKALIMEPKGDLLNLKDEAIPSQDYGDTLALALFGGLGPAAAASGPKWEAFKDDSDWESALVQSASNLKYQRATLGGGFDLLLLDSMYQQGTTMASSGYATTGSASSVAFGSAGRPATLALQAPPSSKHIGTNVVDPFAASFPVEPPSYVQMSDMEKKQRFLVEEQAMWEQYRRGGMQGYGAMSKVHNYPYSPGYSPWQCN
ncbi:Phosphatidylinositol binding clathrin assembly protein 5a [Hibiscus trionum]|uniref:Phosphatidylinositol binding clathrin assembly protein 5a n=1 Tax=Hibiscus trionum TaxID=183268 RepID=A0A9W7MHW6_HIBTR|nr:Phosphatidylinositol binding clathrin assembly protein 5a [Hibiscus trionum]